MSFRREWRGAEPDPCKRRAQKRTCAERNTSLSALEWRYPEELRSHAMWACGAHVGLSCYMW